MFNPDILPITEDVFIQKDEGIKQEDARPYDEGIAHEAINKDVREPQDDGLLTDEATPVQDIVSGDETQTDEGIHGTDEGTIIKYDIQPTDNSGEEVSDADIPDSHDSTEVSQDVFETTDTFDTTQGGEDVYVSADEGVGVDEGPTVIIPDYTPTELNGLLSDTIPPQCADDGCGLFWAKDATTGHRMINTDKAFEGNHIVLEINMLIAGGDNDLILSGYNVNTGKMETITVGAGTVKTFQPAKVLLFMVGKDNISLSGYGITQGDGTVVGTEFDIPDLKINNLVPLSEDDIGITYTKIEQTTGTKASIVDGDLDTSYYNYVASEDFSGHIIIHKFDTTITIATTSNQMYIDEHTTATPSIWWPYGKATCLACNNQHYDMGTINVKIDTENQTILTEQRKVCDLCPDAIKHPDTKTTVVALINQMVSSESGGITIHITTTSDFRPFLFKQWITELSGVKNVKLTSDQTDMIKTVITDYTNSN